MSPSLTNMFMENLYCKFFTVFHSIVRFALRSQRENVLQWLLDKQKKEIYTKMCNVIPHASKRLGSCYKSIDVINSKKKRICVKCTKHFHEWNVLLMKKWDRKKERKWDEEEEKRERSCFTSTTRKKTDKNWGKHETFNNRTLFSPQSEDGDKS